MIDPNDLNEGDKIVIDLYQAEEPIYDDLYPEDLVPGMGIVTEVKRIKYYHGKGATVLWVYGADAKEKYIDSSLAEVQRRAGNVEKWSFVNMLQICEFAKPKPKQYRVLRLK